MSWVAVLTSAAVLASSAGLYLTYAHYNGQIEKIKIFGKPLPGAKPITVDDFGATNYLLVGSDSRAGDNAVQGVGTTRDAGGQRTDTMILVHLSPRGGKATLISFPRDSWVDIPGRGRGKLNSAYAYGGPPLLVATMQNLTGMQIDHYIEIDFSGFLQMTEAVGGVDVCLSQPAYDPTYTGINLTAGRHHISGITALQYVRQRHGLPRGDIDRIQRQQTFIGALVRKVVRAQTLLTPWKLTKLLDVATKSVSVDSGFGINDMKDLATQLGHFDPAHVDFKTIPVSSINGLRAGQSVVLLNEAAIPRFVKQINDETPPAPAPSTSTARPTQQPLTVPPGFVTVTVLNSTSTNGLAHKAADDLARVGFRIGDISTAAAPQPVGLTTSEVHFSPDRADSARTVAAAVPGATLVADSSLTSSVVLYLGSSYAGARAVTTTPASSSATSAPTPRASSTPAVTAAQDPCSI